MEDKKTTKNILKIDDVSIDDIFDCINADDVFLKTVVQK